MPGVLIERERRALQDIEKHLAGMCLMLQEMTGTLQEVAWRVEDALWGNEPPHRRALRAEIDGHVDEMHALIEASLNLLAAVSDYEGAGRPDEHQAALNALHNAGMLPPQEEPPAYAGECD
ncbi:MAG: hypothetical protein EKK51_07725 [Mycolicibacterium sp.]|uniref:hypothetical protein n=1 Tax=Mycolicibacterium sp. TaxID=2320850 RepID=UPI000F8FD31A|nr:hypothetical protein [Mycolicibacterium sp.]RUP32999.1 MAG: hypothetical protein EKK51_07725 [Mycolicibacterium sp.]